ncbi:tRNA (guanine(26)-N(2))-dimethyltransferase isoform X2 [Impatiens glandulifera]|uniref:tRNA (guanine(26)-N(2))-dimethyltransferase isoform X2 n=1 Tax=Impatiens glandulifera TaxID=253017 RepID=UPI001FB0F059|nr:tRNA (guanine(26)-N(2))-dimethyltransferase isoform X2 [Impatiens glandulifera]
MNSFSPTALLSSFVPRGTPLLSFVFKNHRIKLNRSFLLGFICKSQLHTERGLEFDTGDSFFREESATGRDLGVLAASLYKNSKGSLRILDALCGCGIRSLRYLVEAKADFVLANDGNDENRNVILKNLSTVPRGFGDDRRWYATHFDANRLMMERFLQNDYFDLVDVDSFDGFSSGGHRPHHVLDSYGSYICRLPYPNEIGLRMLIGGVVREAAVLGYHVTPLFSNYSFHGPVFRVMLRLNHQKLLDNRHYGFIGYCNKCGHSQTISWEELGHIHCPCGEADVAVSGPLWIGPLHDRGYVSAMLDLAENWGWTTGEKGTGLGKLLNQMVDESDPRLSVGYIKLDKIAKHAKVNSPSVQIFMSTLQKEGYAVSRSHIVSNAVKTNCPMATCVKIAKELSKTHLS